MRLLADTQVLVWYLTAGRRLSSAARDELCAETDAGRRIGVSGHALVELAYAVEKKRDPLTIEDVDAIIAVLHDEASAFEVIPLDLAIGERTRQRVRQGSV